MELKEGATVKVILPIIHWQTIIEHCRRKAAGIYLPDESEEHKAFGLIAGNVADNTMLVQLCLPLKRNARSDEPYKQFMDKLLDEYAIPSKTPLNRRGWVAAPDELRQKITQCQEKQLSLFGTYHSHLIAWQDDPLRDTPTKLDGVLARGSRLLTFVVSMVDPRHPIIKAFYEGDRDREIPIMIRHDIDQG